MRQTFEDGPGDLGDQGDKRRKTAAEITTSADLLPAHSWYRESQLAPIQSALVVVIRGRASVLSSAAVLPFTPLETYFYQ